jgi:preprotein translocase subunit SecG
MRRFDATFINGWEMMVVVVIIVVIVVVVIQSSSSSSSSSSKVTFGAVFAPSHLALVQTVPLMSCYLPHQG